MQLRERVQRVSKFGHVSSVSWRATTANHSIVSQYIRIIDETKLSKGFTPSRHRSDESGEAILADAKAWGKNLLPATWRHQPFKVQAVSTVPAQGLSRRHSSGPG